MSRASEGDRPVMDVAWGEAPLGPPASGASWRPRVRRTYRINRVKPTPVVRWFDPTPPETRDERRARILAGIAERHGADVAARCGGAS